MALHSPPAELLHCLQKLLPAQSKVGGCLRDCTGRCMCPLPFAPSSRPFMVMGTEDTGRHVWRRSIAGCPYLPGSRHECTSNLRRFS